MPSNQKKKLISNHRNIEKLSFIWYSWKTVTYNHGQKSTFVALFQTHQTNSQARIHLHLVNPSPQRPPYNVGHVYTLFLQSFNIVWGGGGGVGGKATQFKTMQLLKCPKDFFPPL